MFRGDTSVQSNPTRPFSLKNCRSTASVARGRSGVVNEMTTHAGSDGAALRLSNTLSICSTVTRTSGCTRARARSSLGEHPNENGYADERQDELHSADVTIVRTVARRSRCPRSTRCSIESRLRSLS